MSTELEKEFSRLSKGTTSQAEIDVAYQKALAATKKSFTPRSPAGKKHARRVSRISGLADIEKELSIREFESGMEEPQIPDLDKMSEEKLMKFWNRYHRPGKKQIAELFPGWPQREMRNPVSALANYASNKAAEKASRRRKDKKATSIYRKITQMIYDELPVFALFKG